VLALTGGQYGRKGFGIPHGKLGRGSLERRRSPMTGRAARHKHAREDSRNRKPLHPLAGALLGARKDGWLRGRHVARVSTKIEFHVRASRRIVVDATPIYPILFFFFCPHLFRQSGTDEREREPNDERVQYPFSTLHLGGRLEELVFVLGTLMCSLLFFLSVAIMPPPPAPNQDRLPRRIWLDDGAINPFPPSAELQSTMSCCSYSEIDSEGSRPLAGF